MTIFKILTTKLPRALMMGVLAFGLYSCADSTAPNSDSATIRMATEMESSRVDGSIAFEKGHSTSAAGATVDSIKVTSVRMLVSHLKLHRDSQDTLGKGNVKVGPFVMQFDSSGTRVFTSAVVPAGLYERIKFEMHKLSSKEYDSVANIPEFQEFAGGDRNTFVIEGWTWKNGVMMPFTFRTNKTENLQVRFEPSLNLTGGEDQTVAIQFVPRLLFKKDSGLPLDPNDADNKNEFEKAIKDALKALRK